MKASKSIEQFSKADKRSKVKAWKDANKLAAGKLLPLADAQMQQFFSTLQNCRKTCDHDLRSSECVLLEMGLNANAVAATLSWCEDNGGYCDCEVVLNAFGHWLECRELN
jgi:Protein of unknown function (DUF2695)